MMGLDRDCAHEVAELKMDLQEKLEQKAISEMRSQKIKSPW